MVGGAVVGAVGAAGMIIGGALTGVVQIVRGVAAAPEAALAPRQGKWWNENEGKWVLTNMDDEVKALKSVPEDDSDLLGDIEKELEASAELGTGGAKPVKDMFYYDALEVTSNADDSAIRRRYYLLAKKYHPDRNKGDATAAEKFKDIAEAYQVLSDPELRKRYDRDGRDGLSPDKTSAADGGVAKIDPTVLFAFLFGSDKFHDYVGRLATATSAQIGDSPKISVKDARKLQRRRVVRLANKLIAKVAPWVAAKKDGHEVTAVEAEWKKEADELCTASYGHQLVTTIGKLYNLLAIQYQGSINSGQGLPSVSKWAERQKAILDKKSYSNKNKMETLKAGLDMLKLQQELQLKMQQASTEEEKQALARQMEESSVGILLRVLWTTTVVDITSTIHEVLHMVLYDQSVDKETRLARSEAIKVLGELWMDRPEPAGDNEEEKDAKKLYEEAAFAAMLETVKRKDSTHA